MADPGNRYCVPRKGPTEPLISQREPSPELDGKSEPDDALVDRDKPPRMPVKCGAVEEVKLSLISDDPVVAHSAEIPLKYHTDPLRPSTSSHPRDEDSKLLEKVDELIATCSSEDPGRSAFEKELDGILDEGNFHAIKQNVTPKTLSRCQTNTLLKAFQVTEKLRGLAHEENPEKDDIEKLEKSLNEFTSTLIDPLKTKALKDVGHEGSPEEGVREKLKNVFHEILLSSCFDHVIDKAIDTKQKKFIAHPAVYNLLNSTWYGSFSPVRKKSWRKPGRWGYYFLNLWTVFDFLLFPLLFAIFFTVHLFKQVLRNRRDIEEEDVDIYEKYKDYFTTPYFIFFRDTLSYLTLVGLHFAICLSPSTISFSGLEWVIFVFFLGRILMEVDQFIGATKPGVKACTIRRGNNDGLNHIEENETAEDDNIWLNKFIGYFSDRWNVLDFITLVFYLITFILRMIIWGYSTDVSDNRLLAVSEYFYGFIAMLLALRTFGQVMESVRRIGPIQIALFLIIWDVITIFWQVLCMILAFSLAITKIYVAEKAYTSGKDSAENLACGESGIVCWWNMATHLSWSLLGLADQDKLNSVDSPSVYLIHLLYSFFLIMAVILLVNMMIALLSNTYQQVQNNSLQEWSFKRAITVRTYSSYHPIPVPFNIFSVPLIILWRTHFDTPASGEEDRNRQSETLNELVFQLQTIYFEKFGNEFPLTEERKIDHLIQENEGSRKMTNQIARQVFQPRANKENRTFGQRAWYDSQGIAVDGCLLTYMGPKFCRECKEYGPGDRHSAKFKCPFTAEKPRLEVLIQETGERRLIVLGVVYEDYNHHEFPGWHRGTVGYHVDDGKIFEGVSWCGREVEGMGYLNNRCHLSITVFRQVSPPCKFVPDHLCEFPL